MTVVNPFSLTATSSAASTAAPDAPAVTAVAPHASPLAAEVRESTPTPVTPYDALCADATRPAAFTMTFREPTAAAA